jgi:hypothetical protein
VPRFYFDVSAVDGSARNHEGHELDGLRAAEYKAIRAAVEIGHESRVRGHTPATYVRVKDENGFLLLTVEIVSMAVRRTVRALTLEVYPRISGESRPEILHNVQDGR